MNLTTFRRSGQPVVTPVWFAREGDRLYVMTGQRSGKVKRIRNSARVLVGPSDRAGRELGPAAPARARVLEGEAARAADALITRKYGMMKRMFDLMAALRSGGGRAYLEIMPADA